MVTDTSKTLRNKKLCDNGSSHSGAAEDYSILGCHAANIQASRDVTPLLLDSLTLKMKALQTFRMSVTIYHSTWRNIPQDLNLLISFDSCKDKFWRTC